MIRHIEKWSPLFNPILNKSILHISKAENSRKLLWNFHYQLFLRTIKPTTFFQAGALPKYETILPDQNPQFNAKIQPSQQTSKALQFKIWFLAVSNGKKYIEHMNYTSHFVTKKYILRKNKCGWTKIHVANKQSENFKCCYKNVWHNS